MIFIYNKTEYPRYIGDIQLEHPEWQVGSSLPEGWAEVDTTEEPPSDGVPIEKIIEQNGKFFRIFEIIEPAADHETKRNEYKYKLKEEDFETYKTIFRADYLKSLNPENQEEVTE